MYQPPAFIETEPEPLFDFMAANPLGLLISVGPEGALADPVPFVLDRDGGERGTLRCHVSRANPQWQVLSDAPEALIVFRGADGYISPSWYPAKAEHGRVVPTWNYAVVEARGVASIHQEPEWLAAQIEALTRLHEGKRPQPWAVSDAPASFIAGQIKGIVGIEVPIASLAGKFKASQNRAVPDRQGVAAGLENAGDAASLAMRDMVRERGGL
ncbi:transcriptional regulator [Devosia pacifica]|uniref:Transcriptional regulator n=1 Tax=Devosia pacifica TaxID=1335967 RepID=A0A918S268_9HYPH|nr:FMN-binding negative transcriptional regulator [Devosia pacifica]GHA21244.1 transcriptional regulator [Devosia pacifica]